MVAPAVSQASSAGQLVGFGLQNTGSTASAAQFVQFHQVFAAGSLPAGSGLAAIVDGKAVAAQMDVTQRYADESVKAAVVTLAQPGIAAGATAQGMLQKAAPQAAAAVPADSALSHGYDLKVAMGISGLGTVTIDAARELATALGNGTAKVVRQGANATEVLVDVAVKDSFRVVLDITAFADGSASTQVQFRNDLAMLPDGGDVVFTGVAITAGGQTQFSKGGFTQHQYQTWSQTVGKDAALSLNVVHDVNHLERIGAVRNYDLHSPIDANLLPDMAAFMANPSGPWTSVAEPSKAWTNVLGVNGLVQDMPRTGSRPDIGPTTLGNAAWLVTQDATAAKFALGQAQAAGSVPWHFYDAAHGGHISLKDHPTLWIDYRGGDNGTTALTQQPGSAGGWQPETAHQPDLSFTAYMLTGDRYHLDQLNAQASWSVAAGWPEPRLNGQGIVANAQEQVRAQAWNLRQIDEAAYANPDGSREKAYFSQVAADNWAYLVKEMPSLTQRQGEIHGILPGVYDDYVMAPWQQDFFATTAAQAALWGSADARAVLKWQANFLSGRFLSADMDPHNGYAYNLNVWAGAEGGTYLKTWAAVGNATIAAGNGWSPGQESGGYYAELALMSNAELITVFAGGTDASDHAVAANAMRAYGWLLSSGDPYLRADLQHQIVPRMPDGMQISADEMHVASPAAKGGTVSFAGANAFIYDNGVGGTTLVGARGSNVLIDHSRDGGDTLVGGASHDYLIGGVGTNHFKPGGGGDYAAVGRGGAVFDADPAWRGHLEIAGFRPATDKLHLLSTAAGHGQDIINAAAMDAAGNVVLAISDSYTVTLNGIQAAQLSTAIFV